MDREISVFGPVFFGFPPMPKIEFIINGYSELRKEQWMENSVERVYNSYPDQYRKPLQQIRGLIYKVASQIPTVGEIEESLKWGQPSYSTPITKAGTPIRLDRFEKDKIAIFFHCQTSLVSDFRTLFGNQLEFSKNRAIILNPHKKLPIDEISICIEMALTYQLKTAKNRE